MKLSVKVTEEARSIDIAMSEFIMEVEAIE